MDCPSSQLLVAAADIVGASVLGHGWDGSYAGARVNIAGDTLVTCHRWEGEHVCQQLNLSLNVNQVASTLRSRTSCLGGLDRRMGAQRTG